MKKAIEKLVKSDVTKIVWKDAEKSILSSLNETDRESFFQTIEFFSSNRKGSEDFWKSFEPKSYEYLTNHQSNKSLLESYEIELLIDGFLGNNYKIHDAIFEDVLMEVSMDYADQKIDSDNEEYQTEVATSKLFIDKINEEKIEKAEMKGDQDLEEFWFNKEDVHKMHEYMNSVKFLDEATKEEMNIQLEIMKNHSK